MKYLAMALIWAVLTPAAAHAAIYIKFDGIDGERLNDDFENSVEALSAQWGVSIDIDIERIAAGGRAPRPSFDDFSWTQEQDKSFPELFAKASSVSAIDEVTVHYTVPFGGLDDEVEYFRMTFQNVYLTGLSLSAQDDDLKALVEGSFAYEQIAMEYVVFDDTGREAERKTAEYNLTTGVGNSAELASLFLRASSAPVVSEVPVPAAGWLFMAALASLGVRARRS